MLDKNTPIENHCCKAMERCASILIEKRNINGQERWMWERVKKSGKIEANEIIFCPYCGADLNRSTVPENKPLTLEQIKQLNLGDTVTIVHSDKITYLDNECFETLYEVWGFGDVKDGTIKIYACEPEAGEKDG